MISSFKNNKIIRIAIALLSIIIVLIFPKFFSNINQSFQYSFNRLNSEVELDSNIILIHINENDIENLNDWPLKRSYYALLIDNLSRLSVKKIGMEIFLSDNISSQNIYNEVLNNSIKNSGIVVLSSIAESLTFNNGNAFSQSILFPSPKKVIVDVKTGHINFTYSNGILIPEVIMNNKTSEASFVSELAESKLTSTNIKVNFLSNWESFQNYSLLEFFEMIEADDERLGQFKGKYILIGVSDLLIAKSIQTDFDDDLPGIGLHAFALDNVLNNRGINFSYNELSMILFLALVFILCFFPIKTRILIGVFFVSLLTFYFLWIIDYVQLFYSSLLFPLLMQIIGNYGIKLFENKKQYELSKSESEELKKEISQRENELELLTKELNEQIKNPSESLLQHIDELKNEIAELSKEEKDDEELFSLSEQAREFEGIIYKSKKMEGIIQLIKKVAPENAGILIMGESGSGKELVANAVHKLSNRKDENFVVVNCAALPDNLLESELFGHVKGAFTDAIKDKIGRFEEADNGTLFLDEIGETTETFQVKLLRVLQSGDFQKVGSSKTQNVDVRIVAATNKNLFNLVKENKFREDLYYRLNVINIELPRLNERSEDIEVLAEHFAKKENSNMSFSKAVMQKLIENEWKGNIRELESTIKRAVIFAKSDNRKIIKLKDLPANLAKYNKNDLENMILESLREKKFSHSSINETAKELGDLNRTIISENYRGIFFRTYAQSNFDIDNSIKQIAATDELEVINKVKSKVSTYLKNIDKDLQNHNEKTFDEVKIAFTSKYKNLPQKYHKYLDDIIKNKLS